MKLKSIYESVILEIYDNLDVSRVKKQKGKDVYAYTWEERDYQNEENDLKYMVVIKVEDKLKIEQNMWPDGVPAWSIYLRSFRSTQDINSNPNNDFNLTGKGNFGSVYKNMLSSIVDFIDSEKPWAISFKGYEKGMESVYARFMKKFLKNPNDPEKMFHEYDSTNGIYVSQEFINQMDDEIKKDMLQKINVASSNHKYKLDIESNELKSLRKDRAFKKYLHNYFSANGNILYPEDIDYDEGVISTVVFFKQNGKLRHAHKNLDPKVFGSLDRLKSLQDFKNLNLPNDELVTLLRWSSGKSDNSQKYADYVHDINYDLKHGDSYESEPESDIWA